MTIVSPPAELVSHVLEAVSFSGPLGASLADMWATVLPKLGVDAVSDDTKQMIWQWLFFSDEDVQLYLVDAEGTVLHIMPQYAQQLSGIGGNVSATDAESLIRVLPTAETQWRYLTGLRPSKKIRGHMGEKPYELLMTIAAHGPEGISSLDLCKETGQDPRSLPVRFKKLTDMGLIIRRRFYELKSRQQTNVCIHTKFVPQKMEETMKLEDALRERNSKKFKELLIEKLRIAPNKIRGFRDLKLELGMTELIGLQKFFGSNVNYLTQRGYIEKCVVEIDSGVEGDDTSRQLYCLRLLKELPKSDTYDIDFEDDVVEEDEEALGVDEQLSTPPVLPRINHVYPICSQIYHQIEKSHSTGVPAKEVIRTLMGQLLFRPLARLLDLFSGYVIDEKQVLSPLKPHPDDPYDDQAVVRTYDFDGKFKFYRYYTMPQYPDKPKSVKPYKKVSEKIAKQERPVKLKGLLADIEKRLAGGLSKAPGGEFVVAKRRGRPPKDPLAPPKPSQKRAKLEPGDPPRKRGRPRKHPVVEDLIIDVSDPVTTAPLDEAWQQAEQAAAAAVAINNAEEEEDVLTPRRRKRTNRIDTLLLVMDDDEDDSKHEEYVDGNDDALDDDDDKMDVDDDDDDDDDLIEESFKPKPKPKVKAPPAKLSAKSSSTKSPAKTPAKEESPDIEIRKVTGFLPQVDAKSLKAFKKSSGEASQARKHAPAMAGSLRGVKRQQALLDLIRERGGAEYTSAKLRRELDERLELTTMIDNKTIARDISVLITSGKLTAEDILVGLTGGRIKRKLLVLVDGRPLEAVLEEVRERGSRAYGHGKLKHMERQVVKQEVKLFTNEEASRVHMQRERQRALVEQRRITSEKRESRLEALKSRKGAAAAAKARDPANASGSSGASKAGRSSLGKPKVRTERAARRRVNIPRDEANVLYRAVVACRSLLPWGIDFDAIAQVFAGHSVITNAELAKLVWNKVRVQFGGLKAVMKGQEEFQRILLDRIQEGVVTTEDLELGVKNLQFFLDVWNDLITGAQEADDDVLDESMPLFATFDENSKLYALIRTPGQNKDVVDLLEDTLRPQKEHFLASHPFVVTKPRPIVPDPDEAVRTAIKAIYTVPESNYDQYAAKKVLNNVSEDRLKRVTEKMIEEKELIFHEDPNAIVKFHLTDRVRAPVLLKYMDAEMLRDATDFAETARLVFDGENGLLLSQAIKNGHMIAALSWALNHDVSLIHVDQEYTFSGYELRSIDKLNLECDLVMLARDPPQTDAVRYVPVPTGPVGLHIWLDLQGNVKSSLWRQIVTAVVYYVCFRPGVLPPALFAKLQPLLGYKDFFDVMHWLEQSQVVEQGKFGGYWLKPMWYSLLGSHRS